MEELEKEENLDVLSDDNETEEEKPSEEEPSPSEDEDEALKKEKEVPKSIQRRLNKLTKYRRTAERERDEAKAKNTVLEQRLRDLESKISSDSTVSLPDPKPNQEDFDSIGDYVDALLKWNEKNKKPEGDELVKIRKELKEIKEGIVSQEKTTQKSEFNKVYRDGIKKFGNEFEDVRDLSVSDSAYESIMNHKNPEDVLFYLINHPEDYSELSDPDLSPVSAIEKIAEIKQQIKNDPKKIINTSQPTMKLGGGSTKGKNLFNTKNQQEFEEAYKKQYGEE